MAINDGRVTCGACRHFQPNPNNPADGMGVCGLGYWMRTKGLNGPGYPPFPNAVRWCDRYIQRRKAVSED